MEKKEKAGLERCMLLMSQIQSATLRSDVQQPIYIQVLPVVSPSIRVLGHLLQHPLILILDFRVMHVDIRTGLDPSYHLCRVAGYNGVLFDVLYGLVSSGQLNQKGQEASPS